MSKFIHSYSNYFSSMIVYGHVDVKYAHYGLDFYLGDANHMVGSFAKLLRDLEKSPVHFFHVVHLSMRSACNTMGTRRTPE